jgi:tetratricopeptide (TPR) repeat protein
VRGRALALGWAVAGSAALGVRVWNALAGPRMWGYDAWGHVAYVLFLDLYRSVPWADQGWSYFHPPLHYALGWLLAQAGSGEVLMRGLALWGSAASLGTAALGAWIVRRAAPERPELALAGFCAVAFLPVHLFMSPMPGNELTLTLLASASLCVFLANDARARPTLVGDAVAGALAGAALLTKFSGLLTVLVPITTLALRAGGDRRRAAARAAVLAGVAFALAAPYYARNLVAFGNPFELSRGYPLVSRVERDQEPGERSVADYFTLPLALFSNPDPRAPHLLHSVWGTVYVDAWADVFRESDVERALETHPASSVMAVAGLLPTAIFAAGAWLAARDVLRGRRRELYVALLVQMLLTLAAFAIFAWRVPIWSALKAGYLMGLSLPCAAFTARTLEGRGALLPAGLVVVWAGSAVVGSAGVVRPLRADAPATGAVDFYFGEYADARRIYGRLVAGSGYPVPWLDNLAAVELAEGHPAQARRLYARAVTLEAASGRRTHYRRGQLAVATALAGDPEGAAALLDAVLAEHELSVLRANRGALRLQAGDVVGAERDLRRALDADPELVPAWLNLVTLYTRTGRPDASREARDDATRAACTPPRGHPYGVGTGEVLEWGVGRRWLLLVGPSGLEPALPAFYRDACARLRSAS